MKADYGSIISLYALKIMQAILQNKPFDFLTSPDQNIFMQLHQQTILNGTACFKKCKQLSEYQHFLLLRDI